MYPHKYLPLPDLTAVETTNMCSKKDAPLSSCLGAEQGQKQGLKGG
jgi:hypothetical protein